MLINYLSLGLKLLNSVLSSVPSYWMSVFKPSSLIIKQIDKIKIQRTSSEKDQTWDQKALFWWLGNNLICRPQKFVGWRILNLNDFNRSLLGKWRWKLCANRKYVGPRSFNLTICNGTFPGHYYTHHATQEKKSSFLASISRLLPIFEINLHFHKYQKWRLDFPLVWEMAKMPCF